MKPLFRMMAAYNSWANRRVYEAAGDLTAEEFEKDTGAYFRSIRGTLNHILAADRIWMKRFTGTGEAPGALDVELHADLESLRAAREAEDRRIVDWLEGLSDAALAGRFTYITVTDVRTVSQRRPRRFPTSSTTRRIIVVKYTWG